MSYGDTVEAQAKRAAKEAAEEAVAVKGKRVRKRKNPAPGGAKAKKAWRQCVQEADNVSSQQAD